MGGLWGPRAVGTEYLPAPRPPHRSRSSPPHPWAGRSAPAPGRGRRPPGPPGAPRSACSGARWRCAGRSGLRGTDTVTRLQLRLPQSRGQGCLGGSGVHSVEMGGLRPDRGWLHPRAAMDPQTDVPRCGISCKHDLRLKRHPTCRIPDAGNFQTHGRSGLPPPHPRRKHHLVASQSSGLRV